MAQKTKRAAMDVHKGSANGHIAKPMNGSVEKRLSRRPQPKKSQTSFAGRSISVLTRLLLWYALITVVFRCPSEVEELASDSPRICKQYLNTRAHVLPYVQPYYDAHLAPYVESVRPYTDSFTHHVYKPSAAFTKQTYDTYGAPRAAQAKDYMISEWQRTVRPPLENAWLRLQARYSASLAPHVNKLTDAVRPYYDNVHQTLLDIYYTSLKPAYGATAPYVQHAYRVGRIFIVETALPYGKSASESAWRFLTRSMWPQMKHLYSENVEPQLKKIGERLGRYKDQAKPDALADDIKSSPSSSAKVSKTASKKSSKATSRPKSLGKKTGGRKSKTASSTPRPMPESVEKARPQIASDLQTWQEKFADAAEEGSIALEDGIQETLDRQIEEQAYGVGMAHVKSLEDTIESEKQLLRSKVKKAVQKLPQDAQEKDFDAAHQEILAAIRSSGMRVKQKAQEVRAWREKYDKDNEKHVEDAAKSTLSVIDHIRNLGLHEIGMRWTWMDGVTYKDWQKYHELRNNWTGWRNEVAAIAYEHEALSRAIEEGLKIEEKAMKIAESAAKELSRMKDVARSKIYAKDASDDFSDRNLPPKIAKATEKLRDATDGVKSAMSGSSYKGEASTSASSASSRTVSEGTPGGSASDAEKKEAQLDDSVNGTPLPPNDSAVSKESSEAVSVPSVPSVASQAVQDHGDKKKVWGGAMAQAVEAKQVVLNDDIEDADDSSSYTNKIYDAAAEVGERASQLSRIVSEAILGSTQTQDTVASVTSMAQDQYERAVLAASSVLYGTQQGAAESAMSVASDKYAQAVAAASEAIYGTPTPTLQYLGAEASSRYDAAVSAAKEKYDMALSRASEQISGTPKPAYEQMIASIENAYSDSLAAASDKLEAALKYTEGLKPTQGPMEAISSIASSRLAEGLSFASAQYTNAKIAVGAQPTPAQQQYLAEAQRRYYEGIGVAHARYSEFLDSASQAVYGTATAKPAYESALSAAQSQYSIAVAAASDNLQQVLNSAKSAVGSTTKSPAQSVLDSASEQYNAAVAAASQSLSAASSRASAAIYGEPTGAVESVGSAISDSTRSLSQGWDSLISKASEQIYGRPTPYSEAVLSNAGEYAAQATDAAIAQYSALQALVSDLVVGKEPDFTESVMNRLHSAYYTGAAGIASSASSYASEMYNSASSVVSTVFTPPATLEAILDSASEQINAAVDAASVQIYGSEKGTVEQATSAAASAYSSVRAKASEAVYGKEPSYVEAAQNSFAEIASSAQGAISAAIYGTPTGTVEAAANSVASGYSSISSVGEEKASAAYSAADSIYSAASSLASDNYAAAKSQVSSSIYGPEQGAMESASNRLAAAVESARARLEEFAQDSSGMVADKVNEVRSNIEDMASSVSSAASSVTSRVKDEL